MRQFWADVRFWAETIVTIALLMVLVIAVVLLASWQPWTLLVSVPGGVLIGAAVIAASGALARRA